MKSGENSGSLNAIVSVVVKEKWQKQRRQEMEREDEDKYGRQKK